MKISNIRLGFATNSSSSHSIVKLKDSTKYPNYNIHLDCEYGWDEFVLNSSELIKQYLGQMLYSNCHTLVSEDMSQSVAEAWSGESINKDGYIDHDSFINFPRTIDRSSIDKTFYTALQNHLIDNNYTIFGGNDNSTPEEFYPNDKEILDDLDFIFK